MTHGSSFSSSLSCTVIQLLQLAFDSCYNFAAMDESSKILTEWCEEYLADIDDSADSEDNGDGCHSDDIEDHDDNDVITCGMIDMRRW